MLQATNAGADTDLQLPRLVSQTIDTVDTTFQMTHATNAGCAAVWICSSLVEMMRSIPVNSLKDQRGPKLVAFLCPARYFDTNLGFTAVLSNQVLVEAVNLNSQMIWWTSYAAPVMLH